MRAESFVTFCSKLFVVQVQGFRGADGHVMTLSCTVLYILKMEVQRFRKCRDRTHSHGRKLLDMSFKFFVSFFLLAITFSYFLTVASQLQSQSPCFGCRFVDESIHNSTRTIGTSHLYLFHMYSFLQFLDVFRIDKSLCVTIDFYFLQKVGWHAWTSTDGGGLRMDIDEDILMFIHQNLLT